MAVATLVSLEEYLANTYDPDREYVDGQLTERNAGEFNHSFLQLMLGVLFVEKGLRAYTELRLQVAPDRFRVPDLMVLPSHQRRDKHYQRDIPYIVVEILSPEDRIGVVKDKVNDYLDMHVPNIWVIDPDRHELTIHEANQSHTVRDRVETHDGQISIDLADLFRRMDEDEAR